MRRLYRCSTPTCAGLPDRALDTEEAPTYECPVCNEVAWNKLTLIHLIKLDNEGGVIKASKHHPPGTKFAFCCDHATKRYKSTSKMQCSVFQPHEATCVTCLENEGHTFNEERVLVIKETDDG